MASNAKTILVFMLLLATVMAAQAKKVSVKNKYCKPITVNGVVIEADGEVDVDVNAVKSIEQLNIDVEAIEVFVRDLFGGDSTGDYSLPSDVTKVEIVQNAQGLVAKVLDAATTTVGSLLDGIIVNVNLEICINL
jgi:hypothetical protein